MTKIKCDHGTVQRQQDQCRALWPMYSYFLYTSDVLLQNCIEQHALHSDCAGNASNRIRDYVKNSMRSNSRHEKFSTVPTGMFTRQYTAYVLHTKPTGSHPAGVSDWQVCSWVHQNAMLTYLRETSFSSEILVHMNTSEFSDQRGNKIWHVTTGLLATSPRLAILITCLDV